jgi:hypothetical protein
VVGKTPTSPIKRLKPEEVDDTAIGDAPTEPPTVGEEPSPPPDDDPSPSGGGQPFPRTERYEYQGQLGLWVLQVQFNSPTHAEVTYTSPAPESTNYTQSLTVSDLIEVGQKSVKWVAYLETLLQQQRSSADTVAQNPSIAEPRFSYCGKQSASGLVEINGRHAQVQFIHPGQIVVHCCEERHSKHPEQIYVKPMSGAALLSLWAIANAETLIGQEFSQLVYVLEFLIETHRSNPYVGELSEFSFERNFPRVTEERRREAAIDKPW